MNKLKQNLFKPWTFIMIAILIVIAVAGCGGVNRVEDKRQLNEFENTILNLAGTDALGRQVMPADGYRNDEVYVGIWYAIWTGQHPSLQKEIRDIQKLLNMGEEGNAILDDRSDVGQFYYSGESVYGYYDARDPFVIARHIELFTLAGIDFVCIDVTNTYDYIESGTAFLEMLKKYQEQGFKVPKVCFYTNTKSGTTVDKVYNSYYKNGQWEDLWFKPNGRPLIVGITENNNNASDQTRYLGSTDFISPAMQRYFEVKESQWPNGIDNQNSMPWMSWKYPQSIHGGYAAVPVAQHDYNTTWFSSMSPTSHRGYNNITKKVEGDYRAGLSFQQMWDSVLNRKDQISTLFVCSWNEGIAQKQSNGQFIDVYNWEYSRDIEPIKGGYNDNFYMQLVKNVRAFKLNDAKKYIHSQKTIDINGSIEQWQKISSNYKDFKGDVMFRNFKDSSSNNSAIYTDNSARNDITDIKVTHDEKKLYFYIRTSDDITPYVSGENWMNILISINSSDKNAFHGYQYIINRKPEQGITSLEKSTGGYSWTPAGNANYKITGNVMTLSVSLDAIGLTADKCYIEFKISDNVTNYKDIMDYYVTGDSAPLGRLNYSYGF